MAIGLACLALLLQAILPIAHVGAAGSKAAEIPGWILASICAVEPASSEDGHAGGGTPTAVERLSCPVCQGLQRGDGLTPPDSITLRPAAIVVSINYLTLGPIDWEAVQRGPAQARAPPQAI